MNFVQRFFSSWQWNKVTPSNYNSSAIFNSYAPVLIDTIDLMRPYQDCPHLQIVINKRAEMFSNMEIKLVKIGDEENFIEAHPILELLKKPTPLQNTEEWLTQYSIYKDVFANNFIYKLRATTKSVPKVLWNLPSGEMKIHWTDKMFKQTKIGDIIKEYVLCWNGKEEVYEVPDVIYKSENFHVGCMKGVSKIESLTLPVSNIIASLKSRNIIITEKGMFGILSNQAKDTSGAIPLGKDERARVEAQLAKDKGVYSDKSHVIVTNSSLKWEAMGFPMAQMQFFEEVEEDFSSILSAYGIDRDIFPSVKGATFENKKQGLITTYQNTIQPEADDLMSTLSDDLGLTEAGLKLIADYSWMPIMQADKGSEESADKTKADKLSVLLDKGIINREAFAEMMGIELTGEEEIVETITDEEKLDV